MENIITIDLGEGNSKTQMFTTIAIANGWAEKIEVKVNKEKVVEKDFEGHYNSIKENPGFVWGGAFKIDEKKEKHTWTETELKDNIPAEEFGKNILVKDMLNKYTEALKNINTPEETELKARQEAKEKAIDKQVDGINVIVK